MNRTTTRDERDIRPPELFSLILALLIVCLVVGAVGGILLQWRAAAAAQRQALEAQRQAVEAARALREAEEASEAEALPANEP